MTAADTIEVVVNGTALAVEQGDTVLRAALRAGVGLSYECNSGSCGTCKLTPLGGHLATLDPDAAGLSPRDRRKGRVLACQAVPAGPGASADALISEEYVPEDRPARRIGRLVERTQLSDTLLHLVVSCEGPASFRSGQYAMVSVDPGGPERAYSMANIRNDAGRWEFIVRVLPEGRVSPRLQALPVGGAVHVDGPYGTAVLDAGSPRDLVCVAAGSGLAPIVSILRGAADLEDPKAAYVAYRDRQVASNNFLAELHDSFSSYVYRASEPEESDRQSFFTDFLDREVPGKPGDYDYYAAGPPDLIKGIVAELVGTHGVPVQQIRFDLFWPAGGAQV